MTPAVETALATSRANAGANVDVHAFTYEDETALYEACVECVTADDESWTVYHRPGEWCLTLHGDGDPR